MDIVKITTGGDIGKYGYSHWSGEPTNSSHETYFVPQSLFAGWECYCSCGRWKAFVSYVDTPTRDATIKALHEAHCRHAGLLSS